MAPLPRLGDLGWKLCDLVEIIQPLSFCCTIIETTSGKKEKRTPASQGHHDNPGIPLPAMVPWTHQIISFSRGILRHQAGPHLDNSADDNVRAWVSFFVTLSACPSRSQMFVPAPHTVSSPNHVQRQKRVEGVSIPANLPSLSRVQSKEAGEMNIWHFQPQLRWTVSTYKEKTRKIAVGQEQIAYTHLPLERVGGAATEGPSAQCGARAQGVLTEPGSWLLCGRGLCFSPARSALMRGG